MIKLTFCLHRLPSLTRDEFQRYWFENHAPLLKKHSYVLRVKRYVQFHSLTTKTNDTMAAPRAAPKMYDGVCQLWWDSLDEMRAPGATPEGRAAGLELLEDERKFIDLRRSPLFIGEEMEILGSSSVQHRFALLPC